MDTSYDDLKIIMDHQYSVREKTGKPTPDFNELIVDLLFGHGIKLRQKDGTNPRVTFSISTSIANAFVVGVRYTKENGSKTEDLFLFRKNQPITKGYKGKLEQVLPEYKGTHKLNR